MNILDFYLHQHHIKRYDIHKNTGRCLLSGCLVLKRHVTDEQKSAFLF